MSTEKYSCYKCGKPNTLTLEQQEATSFSLRYPLTKKETCMHCSSLNFIVIKEIVTFEISAHPPDERIRLLKKYLREKT